MGFQDPKGVDIDHTYYKSIIGSLLYLTSSRLDIAFSVGACAYYQDTPKESHLKTAKRVIQYINGTVDFGFWHPFDTTPMLAIFSYVDWFGNVDDRKNTSGRCFYIGNYLVSWHSGKQNFISLLIVVGEYIVVGSGCTQLFRIKQMFKDYELSQNTMNLFIENSSVIQISKNPVQ